MSDKIWDLCREKDYLVFEASNFLDEHTREDGTLSAKDTAEYERMERQIQSVKDNIARHERLQHSASYDGGQKHRACLSQPGADPFATPSTYRHGGIAGNEYRKNFIEAVRANFHDVQNYLREGALSDGGYLCPTEFNDAIVSKLQEDNVLRQICKTVTTASTHQIPVIASQPVASWIGEGDEIQFSSASFGQVTLGAYKLAVPLQISNELLQDSYYDLESFLFEEFGRSFARAEEEAFLNGIGTSNQPKGILPTLAESATSTLQTTGAEISADDLITLMYSVDRPYRRNASWLINDSTLANIRKLKDSTQNFLWQPGLGEEPPSLLGRPVYTSSYMPPAASGNICVLFGDFSFVVIGERGSRQFRPLREILALHDKTAFLMIERVDIALADRHAIRGLKIR